jgi:hypothetical protein
MHTFFKIINTYFKVIQPKYLNIGLELERLDSTMLNTFINMYISESSTYSIRNKFIFFKKVIDNIFVSEQQKAAFIGRFQRIQRLYWVLNRASRSYKLRKIPYQVQLDLFLNPISKGQHNVITVVQSNNQFLFTVHDLKNIIEGALSHSPFMVCGPMKPKNPYNNIHFDNATLYSIYFFMKRGDFVFSTLFHQYFLCNFNLKQFKFENQAMIRKIYIERHVKNGDESDLYDEGIHMLHINRFTRKIEIDEDFPVKMFVDIMRPYIRLFNYQSFSLDITERENAMNELNVKLKKFYAYNPHFGRKILKVNPGRPHTVTFNSDHVTFVKRNFDSCSCNPGGFQNVLVPLPGHLPNLLPNPLPNHLPVPLHGPVLDQEEDDDTEEEEYAEDEDVSEDEDEEVDNEEDIYSDDEMIIEE